jgi:hypothetical protein
MRRAILLVAVMAAAVLVGSAAVAYAQQPDSPQDKAAQDKSAQQPNTPQDKAAQQPATPQDKAAQDKAGTPPAPADQATTTPSGGAANTAPPSPQNASAPQKASGSPVTSENHSWGGYHWARTSDPFTLKLGNNLSSEYYLSNASYDWAKSTVLDTSIVPGQSNARKCRATPGQDEVCNANYGQNGWLGLASIWLQSGTTHITQGTVKLNDTYFNTPTYNTPAWRQMVTCQEVAHTFGLDHQDTTFGNTNLGTCMDYTNNPLGPPSNVDPNTHDYDELNTIYTHLDPSTTIGASAVGKVPSGNPNDPSNEPGDTPGEWGREVSRSADGRHSLYELDLPNGGKKVTHVRWTEEEAPKHKKA